MTLYRLTDKEWDEYNKCLLCELKLASALQKILSKYKKHYSKKNRIKCQTFKTEFITAARNLNSSVKAINRQRNELLTGQKITQPPEKRKPRKKKEWTYSISSILIYDWFKYLESFSPNESLCISTGVVDFNNHIITPIKNIFPLLSHSSTGGAEADDDSLRDILLELDDFIHPMSLLIHSHPFYGSGGTKPSIIDMTTQREYEQVGLKAIGGIFSRDGYLRFYSDRFPFKIQIYGSGVKEVSANVFELQRL